MGTSNYYIKNITENKLVTTGAYAWVRNSIYSAFTITFTGILDIQIKCKSLHSLVS